MSDQDSTVMRTLLLVIGALVVFMLISMTIANILSSSSKSADTAQDPRVQAKIEANIKPVAQVNIGDVAPAAPAAAADPKDTYQATCFACHGTGAAGAPKLGDKAAWKKRIAQGKSTLYEHALNGFKGMPPRGGNGSLSDEAVQGVVDYMVSQAK